MLARLLAVSTFVAQASAECNAHTATPAGAQLLGSQPFCTAYATQGLYCWWECAPGYTSGSTTSFVARQCTANGFWTGAPLNCNAHGVQQPTGGVCDINQGTGLPHAISITRDRQCTTHTGSGTFCRCQCNDWNYLTGSGAGGSCWAQCGLNGQWSVSNSLWCAPAQSGRSYRPFDLGPGAAGRSRHLLHSLTTLSAVTFCPPPVSLIGGPSPPKAFPPVRPRICNSYPAPGTPCTWSCQPGHHAQSGYAPRTLTCRADGQWRGTPLNCNGNYYSVSTGYGCNAQAEATRLNAVIGDLSRDLSSYVFGFCSTLPFSVPTYSGAGCGPSTPNGVTCTFMCRNGYNYNNAGYQGSITRTCSSGVWSGAVQQLSCAANCGYPAHTNQWAVPASGCTTYTYGNTCPYSCQGGWTGTPTA
eukprot:gene8695-1559_t